MKKWYFSAITFNSHTRGIMMKTNHLNTSLPCFKFSNVQRAFFWQCHSFLLLLGVVLSLTWLPGVQAATDCAAVTEIPSVECEALVALYNSTDGPNWYDSSGSNWNVTDTPCSWAGVTCVDGHVTEIHRYENNLVGTIPSELGNLNQLTDLNLSGDWQAANQLSGSIPSELGNLSQLISLSLNYNQLTGTIPDLSALTNLELLRLFNNQLTGTIPDLSALTNLVWFDLGSNQLTGTIPDLSALTNLQYLYLFNNQLTGTIPDLSALTNLQSLDLFNNQLTGTIPDLSALTNLELLRLSIIS